MLTYRPDVTVDATRFEFITISYTYRFIGDYLTKPISVSAIIDSITLTEMLEIISDGKRITDCLLLKDVSI